jgi:hypothetical protein
MDQWRGRTENTVHKRAILTRGEKKHAEGNPYSDSENAPHYYVVVPR